MANLTGEKLAMDQKLKGQVAIVTGASSGIGAGVSKSLAAAGATVVVNHPVDATKVAAEAVLAEVKGAGGAGITYQCDVSKEDEVKKMFADIISQFGTLDILINNAGLQRDSPFQEMTLEQWNYVLAVNLTGQFLCASPRNRDERCSTTGARQTCWAGAVWSSLRVLLRT